MNKPVIFMILLSFIMTSMSLISRQQHIIPMLLCLETLILLMITYTPVMLNNQLMMMNQSIIVMLSMSVCSASIGLSLVIMTSRNSGNDFMNSQMLLKC